MLGFFMAIVMPFLPFLSMPVSVIQLSGDMIPDQPNPESIGCEAASEDPWTHPFLGTFSRDSQSSCPLGTLKFRSCCRPSHPRDIRFRFIADVDGEIVTSKDFRSSRLLDAIAYHNKPVVWIIPGIMADDIVLEEIASLTDAYVERGHNVLILDWDELEKPFGQSVADAEVVSALLAFMMLESETMDRSLCIGFSMGAHVCAMASKWADKEGKQKLPRCYLLDPSGPGFDRKIDAKRRLALGDCDVMVAVHTSGTVMTNYPISRIHIPGFGSMSRDADCSFEVNRASAYDQPGCADLTRLQYMHMRSNSRPFKERGPPAQRCGHSRALSLFVSALERSCDLEGIDGKMVMRFPPHDKCERGMQKVLKVNTTMDAHPFC